MAEERPKLRCGSAPSFGWLRRPELDRPGADVWETPDGKLVAVPSGRVPIVCRNPFLDRKR